MNITDTIKDYISKGEFFNLEYDRDNNILLDFKTKYPILSGDLIDDLIKILDDKSIDWDKKYFVADLLYYYDTFERNLLRPMLQASIDFNDPSFNRVFVRPCLTSFGSDIVIEWLIQKFKFASTRERIGISKLIYHLNAYEVDTSKLNDTLIDTAKNTENLVELYHYRLALPKNTDIFPDIPVGADSLIKRINGNEEYEELLYNQLGWTNN